MDANSGRQVVVRIPLHPVEAATEADARDALENTGYGLRGPLFGVVAQGPGDGRSWRVVVPVLNASGQLARDSLAHQLWNLAHDPACERGDRRELKAAIDLLETVVVNDLAAAGIRYRVVRADEYARMSDGVIEGPRPTDPEPFEPYWETSEHHRDPRVDEGLVLDADEPLTLSDTVERYSLRGLHYTGERYPADVRAESERAVETHPDVMLLPATFSVVKDTGGAWKVEGGVHGSAHAARRSLDFGLRWMWPRMRGVIELDDIEGKRVDPKAMAPYLEASDGFRAARHANRLDFEGATYRIARTRRVMRWGADGPETPRPSDPEIQEPARCLLGLDDDGNIIPEPETGTAG